jgi:hypothetical protein
MRKLATIRKVDEIRPIEGADAIELAAFGGWQVVVKKAQEIRPGMLVVYCEIDSVFPEQGNCAATMPGREVILPCRVRLSATAFSRISNKYLLKHGG